jgi:hypothetical protein
MTDTAYAIVSGEYSDYTIHAVFTTRELAEGQLFAYGSTWDEPEIKELPLDPEFPRPPAGLSIYRCARYKYDSIIFPFNDTASCVSDYIGVRELPHCLETHLYARDKDRAIKIASERFARCDAEQAGIA